VGIYPTGGPRRWAGHRGDHDKKAQESVGIDGPTVQSAAGLRDAIS